MAADDGYDRDEYPTISVWYEIQEKQPGTNGGWITRVAYIADRKKALSYAEGQRLRSGNPVRTLMQVTSVHIIEADE